MKMRGFTLIELILVVVLIGVLAAVSLPMLMSGFSALDQQRETAEIERESMLALDRISREVRLGREFDFDNACGGNPGVAFERDGAAVEICFQAGQLLLDTGGTSVLARNVTGAAFSHEIHEGACYILVNFSTAGVSETWHSTTYTRKTSCDS